MKPPTILVVEDDDLQYEVYEDALNDYELLRAKSGREALQIVTTTLPHCIILDHILAEGDFGLDYLPELKEILPYVPIVIVSGVLESDQRLNALQGPRRAHYCISKPVDVEELRETIQIALRECGETEVVRSFEALERSRRVDIESLLSRSTDRLSRQNEILQEVKESVERPNVSALARRFGVARRTIIRDLQELIRRGQLDPNIYPKWDSTDV